MAVSKRAQARGMPQPPDARPTMNGPQRRVCSEKRRTFKGGPDKYPGRMKPCDDLLG